MISSAFFSRKRSPCGLLPAGKEQKISAAFATLFILTPVIMSIYDLLMGALGKFGDIDVNRSPYFVYFLHSDAYRVLVLGLGALAAAVFLLFFLGSLPVILKKENLRSRPWFYLFGILLPWGAVSTALSDDPFYWLSGSDKYVCDHIGTFFIFAAFFVFGSVLTDEKTRLRLIRFFAAVNTYLAGIVFLQQTGNRFILYCFPTLRSAVLNNRNYYSYVVCMSVTALFALMLFDAQAGWGRKIYYGVSLVLQSCALLIGNTFGCYLAVLLAIPFIYLCYFRSGRKHCWWIWVPLLLFAAVSVVEIASGGDVSAGPDKETSLLADFVKLKDNIAEITADPENAGEAGSGRWKLWMAALKRIPKRPLFGYGPEGFSNEAKYDPYGPPHNDLLQIAAYLGIPAVIFYVAALVTLAAFLWKNMAVLSVTTLVASGMTVCYLVSSMFGHPVYNTTPFFWLFLGFITLRNENDVPLFALKFGEKNTRKEKLFALGLALFFLLTAVVGVVRTGSGNERGGEVADLQVMKCADVTGRAILKDNPPDIVTDYWFDAGNFTFWTTASDPPEPYGCGTAKAGGGVDEYLASGETNTYGYDEAADYTGSVIRFTLDPEAGTVSLTWVDVGQTAQAAN